MAAPRVIATSTNASELPAGSYGWLLRSASNPHLPIRRGDKITLDGRARLFPDVSPDGPVADRVIRRENGSYELEIFPGFGQVIQAIDPGFSRSTDALGSRIHFVKAGEARRVNYAVRALFDAVKSGKAPIYAKEMVIGSATSVRQRFFTR